MRLITRPLDPLGAARCLIIRQGLIILHGDARYHRTPPLASAYHAQPKNSLELGPAGKATPNCIPVSGPGLSKIIVRVGGFTHYVIIAQ